MPRTSPRKPSAARPRTARPRRKGIERIGEILEAARHVLATEGYAEFSLRRIAREVNIRLSTLQHYYPSKDDLFRSLVERTVGNYDAAYVRHSGDWGPTARSRLAGMARYLVEDQRKPGTHGFFMEFWGQARRDPAMARLLQQAYRQHRDRIRIAMAPLNPSLSGRTAELRAAIVAAMIEGLVIYFAGDQPHDPALEGLEEEIERWVLRMARER
jgi:TetR/AcrR family transcriptional regulator